MPPAFSTAQRQNGEFRGNVLKTRASSAASDIYTISPTSSWSNATLQSNFCDHFDSTATTIFITPDASVYRDNVYFTLPTCINAGVTWLTSVNVRRIMLEEAPNGNGLATLSRFGTPIQTLSIIDSILTYSTAPEVPFALEWTAVFGNHPQLTQLTLQRVGLTGDMIIGLPSRVTFVDLSWNRFSGPIPILMLQDYKPTVSSSLTFNVSHNALTGSVPSNMMFLPAYNLTTPSSLSSLTLDLSFNKLTGKFPIALFTVAYLAGPQPSISISAANNSLSGTIAPALFSLPSNQPTSNPIWSITLDLSNNNLNGSIPSNLFQTNNKMNTLSILLDGNRLTGTIPGDLLTLPVSANSAIRDLTLSIAKNGLVGPIPDTLFGATYMASSSAATSITFDFSGNKINGQIPIALLTFPNIAPIGYLRLDLSSNVLAGTLPPDLLCMGVSGFPSSLISLILSLDHNNITGTIPSDIFYCSKVDFLTPVFASIEIYVSDNQLSGIIPAAMLYNSTYSGLNSFQVDFSQNRLSGPVPEKMLQRLSSPTNFASTFNLLFSGNQLAGQFPGAFFNYATLIGITTLAVDFSRNAISGTIPASLFVSSSIHNLNYLSFTINNNAIGGSIPSALIQDGDFGSPFDFLRLDFSANSLIGAIPSTLATLPSGSVVSQMFLDFGNNRLSGAIPTDLISNAKTGIFSLRLGNNQLSGGFPPTLLNGLNLNNGILVLDNNPLQGTLAPMSLSPNKANSAPLASFSLSLSGTGLSGTIPANSFPSMISYSVDLSRNSFTGNVDLAAMSAAQSITLSSLTINIGYNKLSGMLSIPELPETSNLQMALSAPGNGFSSLSLPTVVPAYYLTLLDVSNMPTLRGTIPSEIFSGFALLTAINVSRTLLSGPIPNFAALQNDRLSVIDVSNTYLDLCPPNLVNRWAAKGLTQCVMDDTNVNDCRALYPSTCSTSLATCLNSTKPSPSFFCQAGLWTSTSVNGTIVIPAGAVQTVVIGDLGASDVVIQGTGSTLVVLGCVNNLTSVTIEITQEELQKLGTKSLQTLLTYSSDDLSCGSLDDVQLITNIKGSGCRKAKTEKVTSEGTMGALFQVDSSKCGKSDRWWIILVSVIGGVLIIVLIIVLLVLCVPKVRRAVRPYSARPKGGHSEIKQAKG